MTFRDFVRKYSFRKRARGASRSGAALVIILCTVVLVTVIALAFLGSVAIERQATASYENSADTRMLADSAVNLVMGQIRQASEQNGSVWTSQPGLLRTFAADGTPGNVYKLYSAQAMSLSASAFQPSNDIPASWSQTPQDYVDLNSPVVTTYSGSSATNYPILDPGGIGQIEGFSTNSTNGVKMPVAWLYLLSDGTVTNSSGMTASNRPVARLAFWTDDDTSKLNINTASEGSFWDTPRTVTTDDYRMAVNQPAQHEFQAYPGHPATTALSPVLYNYFTNVTPGLSLTNFGTNGSTNCFPEVLYGMLPRIAPGGSMGGTMMLSFTNAPLPYKTNALFASVDELAFQAPGTNAGTTNGRQLNPYFTRSTLQQVEFFLTAYNRSPELNLFNMPRVTIWPINQQTGANYRTPFDNLIAFASTLNSNPYYFTRANAYSATNDYANIPRNQVLYQYLQRLTTSQVPGFGGAGILAKYPKDENQILTEIFDYIRCVNLVDTSTPNPNFVTYSTNNSATLMNNLASGGDLNAIPGVGQVVPIEIPVASGMTRGFGRFDTIGRAILMVVAQNDQATTNNPPVTNSTLAQGVLLLETFSPSLGQMCYTPDYNIQVSTPSPFNVVSGVGSNSVSTNFSFNGTNLVNACTTAVDGGNTGGYEGFAGNTSLYVLNTQNASTAFRTSSGNATNQYPFVSSSFPLAWNSTNATNSTFQLSGGNVTVQICMNSDGNNAVVQTINLAFPSQQITVPIPRPFLAQTNGFNDRLATAQFGTYDPGSGHRNDVMETGSTYLTTSSTGTVTNNEYLGANSPNDGAVAPFWITPGDVVRSLEPTGTLGGASIQGDLRLIAATANVPNTAFVPATNYSGMSNSFSALASVIEVGGISGPEALRTRSSGYNTAIPIGANGNLFWGKLAKGAVSESFSGESTNLPSLIPAGINGVTQLSGAPGDWDTGYGYQPNGPYINKSDDGNIPHTWTVNATFYLPYLYPGSDAGTMPPGTTFSSPSRQIPSPVVFGSLPTGVMAGAPWQTLLFCPNPAAGLAMHPGAVNPPDHLLLDLFHMPVVEPYAISEPFSTAGKVNMNYQIIPFTGIVRQTALYGVLSAVKVTAIPDLPNYKNPLTSAGSVQPHMLTNLFRYPIDPVQTLSYFDSYFATNGAFKSASEICDISMIPQGVTTNSITNFWSTNTETGINVRENPYALLYPRLTTRSNTYTVHVRVQTLKKTPSTPAGQWVEGSDKITAEYRGAYAIERYIQPADTNIPDAATLTTFQNFNSFYHYRVISVTQFSP